LPIQENSILYHYLLHEFHNMFARDLSIIISCYSFVSLLAPNPGDATVDREQQ